MWLTKFHSAIALMTFLVIFDWNTECYAITNAQFNANIRHYAAEEETNTTDVKTLQKEYERHASFTPLASRIRFKDPDSELSPSLSHSRGLMQYGHHGYGLVDYEETPHYGYDYHLQDDRGQYDHHLLHQLEHHHDHHPHHGYGHHHKHYDHALATKSVLWPIAGIALLGAAAALVSNPILLQLGVASGKRRRRDTEDSTALPDFLKQHPGSKEKNANTKRNHRNNDYAGSAIKTTSDKPTVVLDKVTRKPLKVDRRFSSRIKPTVKNNWIRPKELSNHEIQLESGEKQFIPIPLKTKN